MTIDQELEAKILRYFFAERWRVNTIATQLGVHHSTVTRVLSQAGVPPAKRARQPSILDPYTPLIIETLEQFPRLSATRVYYMAYERGYRGSLSHFRQHVAELRPRPKAEAYLRLKTLPGEQSQVDWAHFHYLQFGKASRPLMAFVMVLSWSRAVFVRFYLNQKTENFIRGHVDALTYFGGTPRVILYDNLKSAVLERQGSAIRFHPTLLALSAHYRFEPRPVAVARGNEKGRVERAIRYIRDSFFAGRQWRDLDDLNEQALQWCREVAGERRCPEESSLSVNQAWDQEREQLLALPENPFNTEEQVAVSIGKTPYARFDLNDYSVPPQYVRRQLTVWATLKRVRIVDGDNVVAEHERCWGKHEQIEDPSHLATLVEYKRSSRHHRQTDALVRAAPAVNQLLAIAGDQSLPLGPLTAQLHQLLERYGAKALQEAVLESVEHERPHADAVQQCLERHREQREELPPIGVAVPDTLKVHTVRSATLSDYDTLHTDTDTDTDTDTEDKS